jgi:REP element-mobilizing transposase RayT
MSRHLRYQKNDWSTHLITTRCTQGYKLLRPSKRLNKLVAGCLAKSLEAHRDEIELNHYVIMSNHYHLILTTKNARAKARFMCHLNSNLARELCKLHKHRDHAWEGRYASHELIDEQALIGAYQYLFKNSVKERLVSHPSEWPGLHGWAQLCGGQRVEGEWLDRTRWYFARQTKRGKSMRERDFVRVMPLMLTRPRGWSAWDESAYRARCEEWTAVAMREVAEELESQGLEPRRARGSRAQRGKGEGVQQRKRNALEVLMVVLGAEAVCAQDVFERSEITHRRPRPLCRSGCVRALGGYLDAYRDFKAAFLDASRRLREAIARGVRLPQVTFPEGGVPLYLGKSSI